MKCKSCTFVTNTVEELDKHSSEHEYFQCTMCNFKSINKNEVEKHTEEHMNIDMKYKCKKINWSPIESENSHDNTLDNNILTYK